MATQPDAILPAVEKLGAALFRLSAHLAQSGFLEADSDHHDAYEKVVRAYQALDLEVS